MCFIISFTWSSLKWKTKLYGENRTMDDNGQVMGGYLQGGMRNTFREKVLF